MELGFLNKNVRGLYLKSGDLSYLKKEQLKEGLDSDLYIVLGASYIRGWLVDYLIDSKAINIHMWVSPYYRGSSCNFWALYDTNYHLVGATIHMLSKGLDNGDVLFHALPKPDNCLTPYDYSMRAVEAAHSSLIKRIKDNTLFKIKPRKQNKLIEISYSKNNDFNDKVASEYLNRNISMSEVISRRGSLMQEEMFYNLDII